MNDDLKQSGSTTTSQTTTSLEQVKTCSSEVVV